MSISNYGELKNEMSAYLFHTRLVARYDNCTTLFETSANSRLRVRPMEHTVLLTTVNGDVALPDDYLVWRTVRPTFASTSPVTPMFRPPFNEIDYVHPAYLPPVGRGFDRVFTIEGNTFKVRPVDDRPDAFEFHYYRKIPTLTGSDLNNNWLLLAYPNAYLFGLMTELAALNRNAEMAQLYKSRRDEVFAEIVQLSALTTGATSPSVRTSEYFQGDNMADVFDGDGHLIADCPISVKQLAVLAAGEEITVIYHTPQLLRYLLGEHNGAFSLHRKDGRFVTRDVDTVKRFAELQKAIAAAKAENN